MAVLPKLKYTGQCDVLRRTPEGEEFWQVMMTDTKVVPEGIFLDICGVWELLDKGELWSEYKEANPDIKFMRSSNAYFISTAGFEFIFKIPDEEIANAPVICCDCEEPILEDEGQEEVDACGEPMHVECADLMETALLARGAMVGRDSQGNLMIM